MPENNQASDATKPETTDSSSTQPGSQAVDMNHTNAIVPHQISNHDKLVQTMVMVDGEWVNVNDTNDQKNAQEDMHKVNRVVTEAQKDIINAQNAADSAVESADSAISASKVNSDTIKAVNSATVAAQAGADAAMSQANKVMSDALARDSDINGNVSKLNANLTSMSDAVSSQIADTRTNFDGQLKSATAAVDDVKAKVAANSAAIIQNGKAIELQERTTSSAIADLKVADGKIETVAKNAGSQATVATQTANEAKTVATDAKSDATVAIQTASEASIAASDANKSIVEAKINASDAKVIAGKADSTATAASIAASGATLTATNAQSQAMKATAAAGKVSFDLEGVTKQTSEATITAGNAMSAANDAHKLASDASTKADSNANAIAKTVTQVTTNTTNIAATQKALEAKADQTTVDKTNKTVQTLSDQVKATADQLTSKITKADMTDYVDGKGFATETYAQGLVNQTAHDWDVNLSELTKKVNGNEATTTQNMTHLQASIDGIQGTVTDYQKDTTSRFNQLVNGFSSKVWETINENSAKKAAIVENGDRVDLDTMTTAGKYLLIGELIHSPFPEVTDPVSGATSGASAEPANEMVSAADTPVSSADSGASDSSSTTGSDSGSADSGSSSTAEPARKPIPHSAPANVILLVNPTKNGVTQIIYQSGSDAYYTRSATVADDKATWGKWSEPQKSDGSAITQMQNDINFKIKGNGLMSQINLEAGRLLFDSDKIYLDAKSVVFGKDSKAFIPAALITNLTADQITAGTLKSIQINNGGGKFTVNPNGDVVANSITLRNGQFMQGTITGSTIYALNNNGSQDPKLAPKSDWYKITPNMIRWFNHYDQSVGQIGVGQGVMTAGDSSFTGTPGLTISDSTKILLGTAQRTIVTGDEIGNLETTGLDWMSKTNLEISVGLLRVNLDPDQGNEDNGKGAEFAIQKDNKIGAYFGSGDNGNELSITTVGDNNHITFNTGYFNVSGEVKIPDNGLTVRDLHVTRWLGVDGSKNSIVNTSQGTVAINAYETAEYYFGDIGEDQTSSDGKAWVSIEYLFSQTVNTNVPYQVFVTPYSSAHVWVSKRLNNRFLVESDKPNASFAWEIKAKRKGYEYTRLKNVDNMMEKPAGIN